jgi:hypothetical protein
MTKRGKRYPKAHQVEDQSRAQVVERFSQIGWPATSEQRDTGEDLNVRIFNNEGEEWSGLSFYVQLKGTVRMKDHLRKSGHYTYSLAVRTLDHWDVRGSFVALILWDIRKRHGVWGDLREILRSLDTEHPNWRDKPGDDCVSVSLRRDRDTSDIGLRHLHESVFTRFYPLVSMGEDLAVKMTFSFPATPKGRQLHRAMIELKTTGEAIEIPHQYIKEIKYPRWYERAAGNALPPHSVRLEGVVPETPFAISLRVASENAAVILATELKHTRVGRDRVLNNRHTPSPTRIELRISPQRTEMDIEPPRIPLSTAWETRHAVDMWLALRGTTNIEAFSADGKKLFNETILRPDDDLEWLKLWQSFCDNIMELEHCVTGPPLTIPRDLTGRQIAEVDLFVRLLRGETISQKRSIALPALKRTFLPKLLRALKASEIEPSELALVAPPREEEVLGTRIAMCGVRYTFFIPRKAAILKIKRQITKKGKPVVFEFKSVDCRIEQVDVSEIQEMRDAGMFGA